MSGGDTSDRERFEYLVIADCDHCGEEVCYVEEFEQPVALDQDVGIKWEFCPHCAWSLPFWDVKAEYEIDRVQPTQEREA